MPHLFQFQPSIYHIMKLNLTLEESYMILSALRYIEDNLSLSADASEWHFVPGKPFSASLRSASSLSLLRGYVEESIREEIDYHPFNPYIKVF